MAACPRVANLELGSIAVVPKLSNLQILYGLRAKKLGQFDKSRNAMMMKCVSSKSEAVAEPDSITNLGESFEESMPSDARSTHVPSLSEIEYLLTELCDTTSIVELDLKVGQFQLHVTRDLAEKSAPLQPPFPAPITAHSVKADSNSEQSPPLALTTPLSSSDGGQTLLDKAADEGLKILKSPKVGYFRRSRTIKGKRAPPSCKEKDTVKEGQVLCYIEQLGGEIPVESDASGEVVKILKEDGDPVGYGDALISILPSFPGIMKLQ